MVTIKAFPGLRPAKEFAEKVASPPYDVLSSDEARVMAEGNPYTFLHVNKPEIDLDPGVNIYDPIVYQTGADNLGKLSSDGIMKRDESACLYVYRQQMGDHIQTGLVAAASVDDYDREIIKKHEFTRPDKEDDRTRHVDILNANTGPVFLTYRAEEKLDRLMDEAVRAEPDYDFASADGIRHTFWVVADENWIQAVTGEFAAMDCLYVADGHHRSASASRVARMRREKNPGHTGQEAYNFFLSVIFPHNQMLIMDYNRVVKDLNGLDPEGLLGKIGERFQVELNCEGKPGRLHQFGMYLAGRWYSLTAKQGTFPEKDPVMGLDVSILQENLLAPVLGVGDPRKDKRIDFVGGMRGMKELERLVDSGKFAVAFAMYPTSIEELMAIADAGKTMPPKSTWFEPKLRSGLIVHMLD